MSTGDLTIDSQADDLILQAADDFLVQVQGTDIGYSWQLEMVQ